MIRYSISVFAIVCSLLCPLSVSADSTGADTGSLPDSINNADSSDTAGLASDDSPDSSVTEENTAGVDTAVTSDTLPENNDTLDSAGLDSILQVVDSVEEDGDEDAAAVDSAPHTDLLVQNTSDSAIDPAKESRQQVKRYSIKKYFTIIINILKHLPLSTIIKYAFYLIILSVSFIVIVIVYNYLQRIINKKRFMTTTRLSVMDIEVQKACKYIEKNFGNPDLTVDTICKDLVTGPAFLEALFGRELGMSVEDFIKYVRINRASIIKSKDPMMDESEAASMCGYKDPGSFIEDFNSISDIKYNDFK